MTALKPRIDDIVDIMSRIHADRGIVATVDVDPELLLQVTPEDLDEIVGNIIDNAFKWAKSAVRISAKKTGRDVWIVISDNGPGIEDNRISEAFQPGRRMDETVPGDGFGLTIVKELVELHGGSIRLERGENGGLTCSLALPAGS
ncbi:Virulence sensor histidine kinase PhoQ [compost metagenome]